jgi:hypothetical protein
MLVNRNTFIGRIVERLRFPLFVPITIEHARVGTDMTSFLIIKFK